MNARKEPTSVRSVRLADSLWAQIDDTAKHLQVKANALIKATLQERFLPREPPVNLKAEQEESLYDDEGT